MTEVTEEQTQSGMRSAFRGLLGVLLLLSLIVGYAVLFMFVLLPSILVAGQDFMQIPFSWDVMKIFMGLPLFWITTGTVVTVLTGVVPFSVISLRGPRWGDLVWLISLFVFSPAAINAIASLVRHIDEVLLPQLEAAGVWMPFPELSPWFSFTLLQVIVAAIVVVSIYEANLHKRTRS